MAGPVLIAYATFSILISSKARVGIFTLFCVNTSTEALSKRHRRTVQIKARRNLSGNRQPPSLLEEAECDTIFSHYLWLIATFHSEMITVLTGGLCPLADLISF